MPRAAVQDNNRMSLRVRTVDKAKIMRASALSNTGMTDFIIRTAVEAAEQVIEREDRIVLSRRDWDRMMDLLDNPPPANARLKRAAALLPSV
jgi:uncharacterized protein (DUF1778 family)